MWCIPLSIIFSNLDKHKYVNIANFVYYGKTRLGDFKFIIHAHVYHRKGWLTMGDKLLIISIYKMGLSPLLSQKQFKKVKIHVEKSLSVTLWQYTTRTIEFFLSRRINCFYYMKHNRKLKTTTYNISFLGNYNLTNEVSVNQL